MDKCVEKIPNAIIVYGKGKIQNLKEDFGVRGAAWTPESAWKNDIVSKQEKG